MGETLPLREPGAGTDTRQAAPWTRVPLGSLPPAPSSREPAASEAPLVSIGVGCSFEGLLSFRGTTRVDGLLLGDVIATGTLILGETARVRGRIEVDELIVEGQIEGDVVARRRIELAPSARVEGSIESPRLSLAEGCWFRGRCRCVP